MTSTSVDEAADHLVEGIAVDNAGNTNSTAAFVSIDTNAPSLTGSPAEGDMVNGTKPPFVIEYSDALSGNETGSSCRGRVLKGEMVSVRNHSSPHSCQAWYRRQKKEPKATLRNELNQTGLDGLCNGHLLDPPFPSGLVER